MAVNNPIPAATLTMDGLLALADFVKNPDYVERVRELREAQVAHDAALQATQIAVREAADAQAKLDAERAAHAAKVGADKTERDGQAAQLATRMNNLGQLEAALKDRVEKHEAKIAADTQRISASKATLEATAKRLNKQGAELEVLKQELDAREADLNRRLARLREAAL